MMDPTTEETLSRYLDGDLNAREQERLEARLASDADLQTELEALRSMRDAVASLANRMEPPAELDQMMAPLRRDVPRRVPRPALRWLGMAAALALGVTVAVEVARRSPGPSDETLVPRREQAAPPAPTEIFQLKPLPKSAVPPEDQLVGAADRLLASPLPEPRLDEPAAMQVIGPLEEEDTFADEERTSSLRSKKQSAAAEGGRVAEGLAARVDAERDRSPPRSAAAQIRAPKGEFSAVQQERSLVLSNDTGELVARLPLGTLAAPVGAEFEIVVVGGFVSEARRIGEVDDISGKDAALVGLQAPQVEDGSYRAHVTEATVSPGQG